MTTLLFDFDGTLADSLAAIVEITNRLAPEFSYRTTPLEEVEALKGLTARQLIRYSGIPVLRIPALLRRVRTELRSHAEAIPPCTGLPQVIQQLHDEGHRLGIITSNSADAVQGFLAAQSLSHCFFMIDGGSTLFRKGKLITRCIEQYQLNPAATVYVGDEVRDIEAARAASVRAVSVTWGFNSATALTNANPHWLIDDPKRLIAIANSLR